MARTPPICIPTWVNTALTQDFGIDPLAPQMLVQFELALLDARAIQRAPTAQDLSSMPLGAFKAGDLAAMDLSARVNGTPPPSALPTSPRFSADEERTMKAAFTFIPGMGDSKNAFVRELWAETNSTDDSHVAYSQLINNTSYDHQDYITAANALMEGRSPQQIMETFAKEDNPGSYSITLEQVQRMQQMMQERGLEPMGA
jgi:hypothetical protein